MKQKFVKIVCEAFFIKKKNILLSHLGLIVIFIKKGFLNSQAVRIRVNSAKLVPQKSSYLKRQSHEIFYLHFFS
jgi:hypothetical protein